MPARHPIAHVEGQLALPFTDEPAAATRPDLDTPAADLIALDNAFRLLLGIANGTVAPSHATLAALPDALDLLAAHDPHGRLGHVVRRYRNQPATAATWAELVDELAFVIQLGTAPTS